MVQLEAQAAVEEEMVEVLEAQELLLKVFLEELQQQGLGEAPQAEVELHQQVIQEAETEHKLENSAVQAELEFHLQLLEFPYFTLAVAVVE
jgi:hypothetical protein